MKKSLEPFWKKKGKDRYMGLLALICIVGIVLLLFPQGEKKEEKEEIVGTDAYFAETEEKLSALLSRVAGVGRADVMIVFGDSGKTFFAGNTEQSIETEKSHTSENVVLKNDGSGSQSPLVEKKNMPEAVGVLVVAEGASNASVRSSIVRAVQASLGVKPHRIEVLERK